MKWPTFAQSLQLDAVLLILSRTTRMFAYGGAGSLILGLFFGELGIPDSRIGLFMTLTLAGDVALSLALSFIADRWLGRRRTLLLGAVLMMFSGVVFATCENYWVLLLAAVVGVVSATGGDIGPFRPIEESMLSGLTASHTRADVLAWYVMAASMGQALGTQLVGKAVDALHQRAKWSLLDAYHASFWLYVVAGLVNVVAVLLLSDKCELHELRKDTNNDQERAVADASSKSRFSQISRDSLRIMVVLWVLLMVDTLADGMASMPLTTYYMHQKFSTQTSTNILGNIVSASYFLAAIASIFAGPLSRRIGLVATMVFTHIPSSAAVLLFPLPRSLGLTIALLLLRMGLNNMDQAPRSALIAALVREDERTAVMAVTSTLRTLASTIGPTITGLLAQSSKFWVAFVVAGALRLIYDVGLFVMFVNINLDKHEQAAEGYERVPLEEQARSPPMRTEFALDDDEEMGRTK